MSYTPDHQEPEVGLINTPYLLFFFLSLVFFLSEGSSWFSETVCWRRGTIFSCKEKKKRKLTLRGVTTDQVAFRGCLSPVGQMGNKASTEHLTLVTRILRENNK